MDPNFSIDLKTIAGIVALTIAIVHGLKGSLASVPFFEKVPVAAYVVIVSVALTWLSHDVLHWIGGDLPELLLQAVVLVVVILAVVLVSIADVIERRVVFWSEDNRANKR